MKIKYSIGWHEGRIKLNVQVLRGESGIEPRITFTSSVSPFFVLTIPVYNKQGICANTN